MKQKVDTAQEIQLNDMKIWQLFMVLVANILTVLLSYSDKKIFIS